MLANNTGQIPNADRVAQLCYDHYDQLPKTGRPTSSEWTVLSAILQYRHSENHLEMVSLGTGTKCLSADLISKNGDRLNDSHAEIMARRGFIRYLLNEMRKSRDSVDEAETIFTYDSSVKQFSLSDKVSFHFFSSHTPCGDASIFENNKSDKDEDEDQHISDCKKRKIESPVSIDSVGDVLRGFTGGKLLEGHSDQADLMTQLPGAIRTKPGRGIRTLSVSCSDKLSKWSLIGVQGALLHLILATGSIYFESITIAGVCDLDAMERAIWRRWSADVPDNLPKMCHRNPPKVQRASSHMQFSNAQRENSHPAPGSIVWCKVSDKEFEVSVAGKRQGVTKKKLGTPIGRLQICKIELLRQFERLILFEFPEIGTELGFTKEFTYDQAKRASSKYANASEFLKSSYFKCWTSKPNDINDFRCD